MKYRVWFSFKLAFYISRHTVASKASLNMGDTVVGNLPVVTIEGKQQTVAVAISSSLLAFRFLCNQVGKKTVLLFLYQAGPGLFPGG
jgi:hypothetical protein